MPINIFYFHLEFFIRNDRFNNYWSLYCTDSMNAKKYFQGMNVCYKFLTLRKLTNLASHINLFTYEFCKGSHFRKHVRL